MPIRDVYDESINVEIECSGYVIAKLSANSLLGPSIGRLRARFRDAIDREREFDGLGPAEDIHANALNYQRLEAVNKLIAGELTRIVAADHDVLVSTIDR
jgi:hypothetical protein